MNILRIKLVAILFGMVCNATGQASFQKGLSFGDSTNSGIYAFGYDMNHFTSSPDSGLMILETRVRYQVKEEFVIIKMDSLLNPIYSTRIRRPIQVGLSDIANEVLGLPDGGFMVNNFIEGPTGTSPNDFGLFRFDSQGTFMYFRQFHSSFSLVPYGIKYYGQDTILLGFRASNRFGFALTNGNGDPLFTRSGFFTGTTSGVVNSGLIKTNSNNILNYADVFYSSSPADIAQPAIALYDSAGTLQWAYRYQDTLFHYFLYDGLELPNGNFLFCGTRYVNFNTGSKGFVFCISSTGQLLWTKVYNSSPITFSKLTMISSDSILVSSARNSPFYAVNFLMDSTGVPFYSSGYNFGNQFLYHHTIAGPDNCFYSVSGLSTNGSGTLANIISKSYPSDYRHCTNNPITVTATPYSGFTVFNDFIQSNINLQDVPPSRTYFYDYTLPAISQYCASTGIAENAFADVVSVVVSPNPSQGFINVTVSSGYAELPFEILSQSGQLIFKGFVYENKNSLNLQGMKSGIYVLKVFFPNSIVHRKIILTN